MHTLLSVKKRRIIQNKKGFSSIVGSLFAVLIALCLASTLFVWSLSQNTLYNDAVGVKSQLIADQLNENLAAYGATYTPSGGNVIVSALIQNQGGIAVKFVRLWIKDDITGITSQGTADITLSPGQILQTPSIAVPLNGINTANNMSSWFITQRGNIVSTMPNGGGPPGPAGPVGSTGPEGPPAINALTAQGIGSVSMNFSSFRYYDVVGSKLQNYINGTGGHSGYSAPTTAIAFSVILTNYNDQEKIITLNSRSMLWTILPILGTQPRCVWWYIVNTDANGNISPSFTPITLGFNQSKTIVFASLKDLSSGPFAASAADKYLGPSAANLIILGTLSKSGASEPLGQNIPFVSIYFS